MPQQASEKTVYVASIKSLEYYKMLNYSFFVQNSCFLFFFCIFATTMPVQKWTGRVRNIDGKRPLSRL